MEDQDNKIRITVTIAGRPYPLKINAEDEPVILRLIKEVNEKIRQFQTAYKSKDKQDLVAMSLLTYALDLHKSRSKTAASIASDSLSDSILQIDSLLNELLVD